MPRPERIEPGPGQESVWDYPRPPAVDPTTATIRIEHGGRTIAETTRAIRILETSQPPGIYLPPDDVLPADGFDDCSGALLSGEIAPPPPPPPGGSPGMPPGGWPTM